MLSFKKLVKKKGDTIFIKVSVEGVLNRIKDEESEENYDNKNPKMQNLMFFNNISPQNNNEYKSTEIMSLLASGISENDAQDKETENIEHKESAEIKSEMELISLDSLSSIDSNKQYSIIKIKEMNELRKLHEELNEIKFQLNKNLELVKSNINIPPQRHEFILNDNNLISLLPLISLSSSFPQKFFMLEFLILLCFILIIFLLVFLFFRLSFLDKKSLNESKELKLEENFNDGKLKEENTLKRFLISSNRFDDEKELRNDFMMNASFSSTPSSAPSSASTSFKRFSLSTAVGIDVSSDSNNLSSKSRKSNVKRSSSKNTRRIEDIYTEEIEAINDENDGERLMLVSESQLLAMEEIHFLSEERSQMRLEDLWSAQFRQTLIDEQYFAAQQTLAELTASIIQASPSAKQKRTEDKEEEECPSLEKVRKSRISLISALSSHASDFGNYKGFIGDDFEIDDEEVNVYQYEEDDHTTIDVPSMIENISVTSDACFGNEYGEYDMFDGANDEYDFSELKYLNSIRIMKLMKDLRKNDNGKENKIDTVRSSKTDMEYNDESENDGEDDFVLKDVLVSLESSPLKHSLYSANKSDKSCENGDTKAKRVARYLAPSQVPLLREERVFVMDASDDLVLTVSPACCPMKFDVSPRDHSQDFFPNKLTRIL